MKGLRFFIKIKLKLKHICCIIIELNELFCLDTWGWVLKLN